MAKISSFKMAAGIFGVAALVKISVFAIAVAMLGMVSSAQAGSLGKKAKLKNACGELYTLDKSSNRVELFVDPTNGQIAGRL